MKKRRERIRRVFLELRIYKKGKDNKKTFKNKAKDGTGNKKYLALALDAFTIILRRRLRRGDKAQA